MKIMNKVDKARERVAEFIRLVNDGMYWPDAARKVGYNFKNPAVKKHELKALIRKYEMEVPAALEEYAERYADHEPADDIVPEEEQNQVEEAPADEPAANTDDIDAAIALLQAEKDRRLSGVTDVKRVINDLVKVVYADAELHGLYEAYDAMDNAQRKRMKLACMIMGECGEAAGASDSPEAWKEELADIVLSVLSVAGYMGVMDFGEVLEKKRQFNTTRPYQHKGE